MTVKELINKLMDYPMDIEVAVEVNSDKEYSEIDVAGIGLYHDDLAKRVLLCIDGVEVPNDK
jgi:hypothetical protein